MFSHCYQSGSSIEIYNGHDKSLFSKWKFTGRHSKIFDSSIRNYMHILDQGALSKMELPRNSRGRTTLGIFQSYIVFQIYLFSPKQFSIEIAISDTTCTKRRLIFSTNNRDLNLNQLHCRIPILNFPIGKWVNCSIDILSFVSVCFKDLTFRSIDYICLSMSGKVREIFTMRTGLNTGGIQLPDLYLQNIPDKFMLPDAENINMNFNRVFSQIYIENQLHAINNENALAKSYDPSAQRRIRNSPLTSAKGKNNKSPYRNETTFKSKFSKVGNMVMVSKNNITRDYKELNNQREFVNLNNNSVNNNISNISGISPNTNSNPQYKMFNKEEYTQRYKNNIGVVSQIKKVLNPKWENSGIIDDIGAFDNSNTMDPGSQGLVGQISTIKNEGIEDRSEIEIPPQMKDLSPMRGGNSERTISNSQTNTGKRRRTKESQFLKNDISKTNNEITIQESPNNDENLNEQSSGLIEIAKEGNE